MTHRIWAIVLNTFREAVRQKILYTLIFFTVALILFSFFLGQLSLGADTKVIKDMGLASIMVFASMIAIFMGIGLVYKEIERRTIYTILSKPVGRAEFVVGKFLGLALTIALEVVVMTALLFIMLSFYTEPLDFNLIKAVILIYLEVCILISVALTFSSYSSSLMSTLFCISFLIIGHITDDFADIFGKKLYLATQKGGLDDFPYRFISGTLSVIKLLSLDHFSINARVVHGVYIPWGWIGTGFLYAMSWITIFLIIAIYLFRKKDLV